MDHREESSHNYSEVGPTYKALYFGACAVIGWFLTDFVYATRDSHTSYERRLTELETGAIKRDSKIERLEQDVDASTRLLRELEREAVRRRP